MRGPRVRDQYVEPAAGIDCLLGETNARISIGQVCGEAHGPRTRRAQLRDERRERRVRVARRGRDRELDAAPSRVVEQREADRPSDASSRARDERAQPGPLAHRASSTRPGARHPAVRVPTVAFG